VPRGSAVHYPARPWRTAKFGSAPKWRRWRPSTTSAWTWASWRCVAPEPFPRAPTPSSMLGADSAYRLVSPPPFLPHGPPPRPPRRHSLQPRFWQGAARRPRPSGGGLPQDLTCVSVSTHVVITYTPLAVLRGQREDQRWRGVEGSQTLPDVRRPACTGEQHAPTGGSEPCGSRWGRRRRGASGWAGSVNSSAPHALAQRTRCRRQKPSS
jgi:hypothetical protein